jgi:hypothetical protein
VQEKTKGGVVDEDEPEDKEAEGTPRRRNGAAGGHHADEDGDDDEYAESAEGGVEGEGEGEGDEEGDEFEEPDSPTNTYQRGGLGVGSRFFNLEDVRWGFSCNSSTNRVHSCLQSMQYCAQ